MSMSAEEADALAMLLNQTASATISALLHGEPDPAELAPALVELAAEFAPASGIARFLARLAAWLGGARPSASAADALGEPFGRALATMLARVPEAPAAGAAAPISRRTLTQLIAATMAARASGDEAVRRQLAATLVTTHGRLPAEWRDSLGALLENLRLALGAGELAALPPVPEPYLALWESAKGLMLLGMFDEGQAHGELLERLIHNAAFARRAANPELSGALASALLDVQRHALESERAEIATLIGAIRAELLGENPAPFVALLGGAERAAWERLQASAGHEG